MFLVEGSQVRKVRVLVADALSLTVNLNVGDQEDFWWAVGSWRVWAVSTAALNAYWSIDVASICLAASFSMPTRLDWVWLPLFVRGGHQFLPLSSALWLVNRSISTFCASHRLFYKISRTNKVPGASIATPFFCIVIGQSIDPYILYQSSPILQDLSYQ